MEFDKLSLEGCNITRISVDQLTIKDINPDIEFPSLDGIDLYRDKHKSKTKSKSKKSVKKTGNNIDQISINSIKTAETKKELKSTGVGVISITGDTKSSNNSFIRSVSDKTRKDIEERNKELMRIREHPYIRRKFILTEAEKKLYRFLRERFDKINKSIVILSKVRLGDIVELNEAITRDSKLFLKIAYKHVDFCILSPELDLICVVELDDFTHDTVEAIKRDNFVAEVMHDCNIPLYRVKCRIDCITADDTRGIEMCILEYLAPVCNVCGRPMEPKESRKKYNYGLRFYGCMGFYEKGSKQCRNTIDID